MITIQNYVQAESLEEAWRLNQNRSSRILGGMLWTKMERRPAGTAIDLCRLGLDTIEETEEEFILGAMVTLRQIEQHPGLNRYTQGAAARSAAPAASGAPGSHPRGSAAYRTHLVQVLTRRALLSLGGE